MDRNRLKQISLLTVLVLAMALPVGSVKLPDTDTIQVRSSVTTQPADTPSYSPESNDTQTAEPTVVSTASLTATGDLLIHDAILEANYNQETDSYDFSSIFTYLAPYIDKADFAAVNLEVPLAGDSVPYRGYPQFNCPDEIADAAKAAGFDLFLTANNHTNDGGLSGIRRTVDVLNQKGIRHIGTRETADEKRYLVHEVNGIAIGMINYTYGVHRTDGKKSLNLILDEEAVPLVNLFDYQDLDSFYAEAEDQIQAMKQDGAEAIVFYIHWGTEYQLAPDKEQRAIAQKLCDLGVDVIIGGHPHVVQPLELLTSLDTGKQTICLYSMGNAVSNQRTYRMDSIKTGHTEDGLLFTVNFSKLSDGTVKVAGVDILPTWVHLYQQNGRDVFQIIPLDKSRDWNTDFNLTASGTGLENAKKSYDRTMALVGNGLALINQ